MSDPKHLNRFIDLSSNRFIDSFFESDSLILGRHGTRKIPISPPYTKSSCVLVTKNMELYFFFSGLETNHTTFFGFLWVSFFFLGPLGAFRSCLEAFFVRFVFRRIFYLVFRLSRTLPEGPKSGFRFGESTIFVFFHALI